MGTVRVFLRFFLYLFVPSLIALGTYNYLSGIFFSAYKPLSKGQQQQRLFVEIGPGLDFSQVCQELEKKGIIAKARNLSLYAKLKGDLGKIVPGEYILAPSMTPKQILETLAAGKVYEREIVVTPGMSIWEIGALLNEKGVLSEVEFNKALTMPDLLARAGVSSSSFEGYLAPGSYSFSRPVDPKKVIWTLLEKAEQLWPAEFSGQADEIRLSRHEVLTLASIIERTTNDKSERAMVSSVLHNRLNHGMKLESEEALIYGLRDYNGVLSEEDKKSPTPYNTFTNFGLPPGPIANPGEDAIRAALFPEETSYLFYLKTPGGKLEFSATLNEHKQKLQEILGGMG